MLKNDVPTGVNAYSRNANFTKNNFKFLLFLSVIVFGFSACDKNAPNFIEMISVQGGTFMMGADPDTNYQVTPVHQVTLSDFQISKYEITNAQFVAFLNAVGNQAEAGVAWFDQSYGALNQKSSTCWEVATGHENRPIFNVTWYGAVAYCNWAGGRLPTEAEWEYAAKGGNQSAGYIYAGSNSIADVAITTSPTQSVGQKMPNELGVYDMSGNVNEWCNDWYENYQDTAQINPQGPTTGLSRTVRGGSHFDSGVHTSFRMGGWLPNSHSESIGFRLVR